MSIRNDALRGTRDIILLKWIRGEVGSQGINHSSVSAVLGRRIVVRDGTLNIEIESVHHSVAKWSGAVVSDINGAKRIPQEFSKGLCRIIVLD